MSHADPSEWQPSSSTDATLSMHPVLTITTTKKQRELLLRTTILICIWILGFGVRMFSVLRYESIIHEFDPWFNYRSTKVLVEDGLYAFWNWFDHKSWYPLGRVVGGTVYPGIMWTAALLHSILGNIFLVEMDIKDVCVVLAPVFAGITGVVVYVLTTMATQGDTAAGLWAAALMVMTPSYMSRSSAGSFDNEAVSITALVLTFALFAKAVETGSLAWTSAAAMSYLYMVSTWGGYVFIINIFPIYVLVMVLAGRYTHRLYVAYSCFYVLGTLFSMQIRFVGFSPVTSSEHLGALGVFVLVQVLWLANWVNSFVPPRLHQPILRLLVMISGAGTMLALSVGAYTGSIGPWTGRFYTLLDPTYASKYIPIIASVSEHQPSTWIAYFADNHLLILFMPVGVFFCFQEINETNVLLLVFAMAALYFSGVMVRLMLVLSPVVTIFAGIGISRTLREWIAPVKQVWELGLDHLVISWFETSELESGPKSKVKKATLASGSNSAGGSSTALVASVQQAKRAKRTHVLEFGEVGLAVFLGIFIIMVAFVRHCVWSASEKYSNPTIILSYRGTDGQRMYVDDFREAYYWLAHNTAEDARILSWWDWGYNIGAMSNRTTIVDNNTWNNTHIAMVGKVLASPEDQAYDICRKLDVTHVVVFFGGLFGYSSDDLNKFLWPVRIVSNVDPSVREADYLSSKGEYAFGNNAGKGLIQSLLFKLSYYRFADVQGVDGKPVPDRVRGALHDAVRTIDLVDFEEVFTSLHWIVRVYRMKEPHNRGFNRHKLVDLSKDK